MTFDVTPIILSFFQLLGIYGIMSLSLNLDFGYAGVPNLGKVIPWAVGSVVIGLWSIDLIHQFFLPQYDVFSPLSVTPRIDFAATHPLEFGLIFLSGAIIGVVIAMITGLGLSLPAIRVRADYLALVLLFGAQILQLLLNSYQPLINGAPGLVGVPQPFLFISDPTISSAAYTILIMAVFIGCYFVVNRISESPYGRNLKAMRDDELALSSSGKNVVRLRASVIAISCAIAGLGGVLYGGLVGSLFGNDFSSTKTLSVYLMVVVGGAANNKGAVLGAALVTLLQVSTRVLVIFLPSSIMFDPDQVGYLIYTVMFLLFLRYRPNGLLRERPMNLPSRRVAEKANHAENN